MDMLNALKADVDGHFTKKLSA